MEVYILVVKNKIKVKGFGLVFNYKKFGLGFLRFFLVMVGMYFIDFILIEMFLK